MINVNIVAISCISRPSSISILVHLYLLRSLVFCLTAITLHIDNAAIVIFINSQPFLNHFSSNNNHIISNNALYCVWTVYLLTFICTCSESCRWLTRLYWCLPSLGISACLTHRGQFRRKSGLRLYSNILLIFWFKKYNLFYYEI